MTSSTLGRLAARLKLRIKNSPDRFLGDVTGVVHVGANTGQERKLYGRLGLQVLWIEPIPEIFAALQDNLTGLVGQRAIQSLVTDRDGAQYRFNVASNNGASSSILELGQHKDIWPQVQFTRNIDLTGVTLSTLYEREGINPARYQALVMDTQGSELLVLKGAIALLRHFSYVKTEAPDFESYKGCCRLADIESFMATQGFQELVRRKFATHPQGGSYFDVVYKNKEPPRP